jgi:hypothetical protein
MYPHIGLPGLFSSIKMFEMEIVIAKPLHEVLAAEASVVGEKS